jgi:acetolactate synthase-1/2/3 large subunit
VIKVTDYIVKRLEGYGVRHVFMITGGGAMHLNDSFGASETIRYICNHHEQASAIGAEGYSRVAGSLSVVVVTSGPGGTNTLTGVIGQWLDSVPVLYLSGQVKQETTIESCRELGLRQLGDQEINIVDMVRPVTKFAAIVQKPEEIGLLLDKALFIATHGRPGPVWLDIPLDIQGAQIDEAMLPEYTPDINLCETDAPLLCSQIAEVVELLKNAKRPVFLAGQGIRISAAQQAFLQFVERLQIPVVSSFSGVDLIDTDHPLFMGRIGTIGTRSGNFTLQNADLLISVGSRNNIRQVSYNWKSFAREAVKVIVDIDAAELIKPTVVPDLAIQADAGDFLEQLGTQLDKVSLPSWVDWLSWCRVRREKYPFVLPKHRSSQVKVNPYHFIERLSAHLANDSIVVAGNGTACVALFQAARVKQGQRLIWNSGCASMGYDLPASIGACFAADGRDVVCLAGDGSLQMNIQEFQTVFHHQLPLKLFVLSNNGYISIRQTHQAFFGGRLTGCDSSSGVSFPDVTRIAAAYGLSVAVIDSHDQLDEKIAAVLATPGPVVCDIRLQHDYIFEPKLSSEKKPDGRMVSKPLEDLFPFLDREEFKSNLLIQPWDEGDK